MTKRQESYVDPAVAHAIEEAVMFGKPRDIDALLEDLADDDEFPEMLRYGLESLRYFREHYGQNVPAAEAERKKVALLDTGWVMELLEMLKRGRPAAARRA